MDSNPQPTRLSAAQLRLFMAVLLQNEPAFQQFYGKLAVENFSDESHQLLYRMLLDFWEQNEALPCEAETYVEIETYFDKDDEIISSAGRDDLEDLLNYAFDEETFGASGPSSAKMTKFAFRAGKRLLQQCYVDKISVDLKELPTLDMLSDFFNNAATQTEWLALNEHASKPKQTLPEQWANLAPYLVQTTGLSFLDKYMAGGARKQ
jgi:replicative DNA helicase